MSDIRAKLTTADWALLHLMRGSLWGPGATLGLPSGLRLTGDQVAALLPREDSASIPERQERT